MAGASEKGKSKQARWWLQQAHTKGQDFSCIAATAVFLRFFSPSWEMPLLMTLIPITVSLGFMHLYTVIGIYQKILLKKYAGTCPSSLSK